MRRLLTSACVCACVGLAGASFSARPASACLNDRELPAHEREFRSQYLTSVPTPTRRPLTSRLGSDLVLGVGLTLLAVGGVTAFSRARAKD